MELKKKFVLGISRMKITWQKHKSYFLFFFYRKYGLLLIPELRITYFCILCKFLYCELLYLEISHKWINIHSLLITLEVRLPVERSVCLDVH